MSTSRAVLTINTPDDRDQVARWARNVEWGTVVEFKKKTRSVEQNAKLHAMLAEVSDQVVWYGQKLKVEDWKNMFTASLRKAQVVPGIDPGTVVPLGIHTSTMTIDEMSNMIELIYAFGAEPEHRVTFHDPNQQASDAPTPDASDVGESAPPPSASPEPAGGSPSPAGSSDPDSPRKREYYGDDLKHLREFAFKAVRQARGAEPNDPISLQFLNDMWPNYTKVIQSSDGYAALKKMKEAMEGVIQGQRNIDRVEAWMKSTFLTEATDA